MKRATSIISAFCLGLFISIGILACAVDDYATPNTNSAPSSDLQIKSVLNVGCAKIELDYNDKGRISSVTRTVYLDSGTYTGSAGLTYDNNSVKMGDEFEITFNNQLDRYTADEINTKVIEAYTFFYCLE